MGTFIAELSGACLYLSIGSFCAAAELWWGFRLAFVV
jgi:hypothetical protein